MTTNLTEQAPSTQVPAIELRGLTKTYGQYNAVNNLNLVVPQGAVLGFLGPNGAGKTTLIRMLLGLVHPTKGEGRILGYDIQTQKDKILPLIGAVVETPTFYSYLSGYDNLKVIAYTGGIAESRIQEVLDIVQMTPRAKEKMRTYSLGMRQRLGIASCLLSNPRIIFLDEPSNGLDPQGTIDVRNMVMRLGQMGHTVFLTSHLLHEIEQTCNYVAIIKRGTMVVEGYVKDLLERSGHQIMIETQRSDLTAHAVNQVFGQIARPLDPYRTEVTIPREQIPNVVKTLVDREIALYSVMSRTSSLEQYFIEVTADSANPFDKQAQLAQVSALQAVG